MNLTNTFKGLRPDITPLAVVAFLIAGVPSLLVLVGVSLGAEQEEALDRLLWLAGGLLGTDVLLRGGRNYSAGKTAEAAATAAAPIITAAGGEGAVATPVNSVEDEDAILDAIADDELPSDEEELLGVAGAGVRPDPPDA